MLMKMSESNSFGVSCLLNPIEREEEACVPGLEAPSIQTSLLVPNQFADQLDKQASV